MSEIVLASLDAMPCAPTKIGFPVGAQGIAPSPEQPMGSRKSSQEPA
jgi:hypothetical protein